MALAWVVKVDNVKFRLDLVAVQVVKQMIVSDFRKVRKLIIIQVERKNFLDLLFYVIITTAYDFPLPGVPNTMLARKTFTTLI